VESLVLFLLEQGSTPDAIRLYEEETGVRRGEAKRAIQRLAQRHGLAASGWRLADLVTMALLPALLIQSFVRR
jgi:hypothetical protein